MLATSSKKVLGVTDIVLMTIVANLGLRWLAVAAGIGPVSIILWLVSALFLFFPLTIACAELAKLYPEEGGLYAWVRHTLGEHSGFIVAWLYWAMNLFYYPALLIFLASNFAYFLGKPSLAGDQTYITVCVIAALWIIIAICLLGLRVGRYVVGLGGIFGTLIPAVVLIVFGFLALLITKHSATAYTIHSLMPSQGIFDSLSTLTIIMFAMTGIEVIPTFANSVKNAKRTLYTGLLIAAFAIFGIYVLGTLAMSFLLSPADIAKTSGLMEALAMVDLQFHVPWFTRVLAFFLTFAELAAITMWILAPIVMFFKCSPPGILPAWLQRTNRSDSPYNAVLMMGVLVTIVVLLTNLLPSINDMYQILVLMASILTFIPYLFLAVVFIRCRHKITLPNWLIWLMGLCIFGSIVLGIVFSFPPPEGLVGHALIEYETELALSPIIFVFLGWALYRFRRIAR